MKCFQKQFHSHKHVEFINSKSSSWIALHLHYHLLSFYLFHCTHPVSTSPYIAKLIFKSQGTHVNRNTCKIHSIYFTQFRFIRQETLLKFTFTLPCLSDVYHPMDTMSTRHQSLADCGFQVSSFSFLSNSDNNGVRFYVFEVFVLFAHG